MVHEVEHKSPEADAKTVADHLMKASPEQAASLMRAEYLSLGPKDFNAMTDVLAGVSNDPTHHLNLSVIKENGKVAALDLNDRTIYNANETTRLSPAEAKREAGILAANLIGTSAADREHLMRVESAKYGPLNSNMIFSDLHVIEKKQS